MAQALPKLIMAAEDYLEWEPAQLDRHEYLAQHRRL